MLIILIDLVSLPKIGMLFMRAHDLSCATVESSKALQFAIVSGFKESACSKYVLISARCWKFLYWLTRYRNNGTKMKVILINSSKRKWIARIAFSKQRLGLIFGEHGSVWAQATLTAGLGLGLNQKPDLDMCDGGIISDAIVAVI